MTTLRPYPSYRQTDLPWLGQIPAHWDVKRLKNTLSRNDGGVWGDDTMSDDEGVIVLRSTDVGLGGEWNISDPARRNLSATEFQAGRLLAGDLLVTKSSGSALHLGKTALVTSEIEALNCCFSNFMQRLRANSKFSPEYIYWIMNSIIGREQLNYFGSTTTGLNNLTGTLMGKLFIAAPPLPEQQRIAAYLDHQTIKIDALIAKKGRLLDLLAEQRVALISQAVTKGWNPDVKMKDSGVAWLGQVPEHWEVLHLRRVINKFVDYRGHTPQKVDDGIPLITARNIKNGKIDWELSQEYIPEDLYDEWMVRGFPEIGDVLITMEAPLGETAQITQTHIALAQRIVLLKADKTKIENDYLKYFLASTAGQGELWSRATGSTAIGIKASHLKEIIVLVPTIDEQIEITKVIEKEEKKIFALIAKVETAIQRLHEYRAALISSAVTGKVQIQK